MGLSGEVTSGVLFGAGGEGLVETVLEVGLEDTAGNFDPSEEGAESISLEIA